MPVLWRRMWGTKGISKSSKVLWLADENLVCSHLKLELLQTVSPKTTVLFFPPCHFQFLLSINIRIFISPFLPLFLLPFPAISMFFHHIILAKLLSQLNPTSCPTPKHILKWLYLSLTFIITPQILKGHLTVPSNPAAFLNEFALKNILFHNSLSSNFNPYLFTPLIWSLHLIFHWEL